VTALVYANIIVQRRVKARPVFTVRREAGQRSGRDETEWLLAWETAAMEQGCEPLLAASRPIASQHLTLQVSHQVKEGELRPENFTLLTDYPFRVDCKVQPWVAFLLARCDGSATALQIFDYCRQNTLIHSESSFAEFANLLRTLVAGGFLVVEAFRLPEAEGLSAPAADCESHLEHGQQDFERVLPSPTPHPTGSD